MTFIHQIASVLIQNGWDKLKNYTLVFPMQRAEMYFKQQFRELMVQTGHHQPIVLPRMLTIDALVDELSDLRVADEIRSVCSLYNIYLSKMPSEHTLTLDAFYGWGRQLLQDFNSIDMSLKKPQQIINNLSEVKKVEELDIDEQLKADLKQLINFNYSDERINAFFHQLWQVLPDIYDTYTRQQQQLGMGTRGACYRYVIDHFDELMPRLDGRTIVFIGFNYLLPAEQRIMQLFHDKNMAMFFWDMDDTFTTDPSVYQFIKAHQSYFPNALKSTSDTHQVTTKHITAISTMSSNAQIQYINQWLNRVASRLKPHQRAAVVITDETVLESAIYALPQAVSGKVNITKGFPLRSTAIYAEVRNYLNCPEHDRLCSETTYAGVLNRLCEALTVPEPAADLQDEPWQQALQREAYCQTLLVINRFVALCEEGVLAAVSELRTIRNLLCRALDSVSLPFHGEPVEQIQVIGVLETRLLDFDYLLVLNVEEGVVPGKSTDRSFIPFDLRKAYRMPTHDEEAKIYAYNFFRLIRRSSNTTLLYSEAAGDMTKKSMSRFLMQMLISEQFNVDKYRLTESTAIHKSASVPLNKTLVQATNESNRSKITLSPSAIGNYIECPRKFYLNNVLGLNEVKSDNVILSPSDMGTFFHGAVKHAYYTICAQHSIQNTPVSADAIKTYIDDQHWLKNAEEAILAGFQEIITNYNEHNSPAIGEDIYHFEQHKAESEVIRTMLKNVLSYDAEHSKNLQLIALEQKLYCDLQVGDQSVLIGGYIDRLDSVIENGTRYLRILDYKTGSYQADKMTIKSIEDLFSNHNKHYFMQTMFYSYVCSQLSKDVNPNAYPIMPQLLYTQKLSADKHMLMNDQPILDFEQYKQTFEQQLQEIINKILKEPLPDMPWQQTSESNCEQSFCPFHILCGREKKDW